MKTAFIVVAMLLAAVTSFASASEVRLSSLDLSKMQQGWGTPQVDQSVTSKPLTIAGRKFDHGVGTHAQSTLWVNLAGGTERFQAWVGVDDGANQQGTVDFAVYADGKKVFKSGTMRSGDQAKRVDVQLTGTKTLLLKVGTGDDNGRFDHANWAEAVFEVTGESPKSMDMPKEEKVILTPKAPAEPRINGASVYGCRPGNPFLYRVPCTGTRPIQFSAVGLPPSLILDPASGIITGTAPDKGEYKATIRAKNSHGEATREFRIVSGEMLSLTPYMGWNHWYAHYDHVTDKIIRDAADAMVNNGMADYGYSYVSIDDCWMRKPGSSEPKLGGEMRDAEGRILPNANFPDMRALTDFIHAKGLKAGTYTSPGPKTCGGYEGAYGHEAEDAKQFADWGFDLLKYDLCSYREITGREPTREQSVKPMEIMGKLLKQQKRDIVYNLCQYGIQNVWEWGAEVDAHSWRTSGDLGYELARIFPVAAKNAQLRAWNGPGHWNDPDYIQIGYIGNLLKRGRPLEPCWLTPTEQYSYMSLWSLLAVPLMVSNDLTRMDEFTLNVLCNSEVLDINQDPLGQSASLTPLQEDCFMLVKEMEDGSKAVGLCNGGEMPTELTANWTAVGISGKHRVRDVWRQKDLPSANESFTASVPRHGVVLIRLTAAN